MLISKKNIGKKWLNNATYYSKNIYIKCKGEFIMEEIDYIAQNEREINKDLQKLCRYMILATPIFLVFYYIGMLTLSKTLVYFLVTIILITTMIGAYSNKLITDQSKIKWVIINAFIIQSTLVFGLIFINGVLMIIVPLAIAGLYFDRKLIKYTLFMSIIGYIIGDIIASYFKLEYIADFQWIPLHLLFYGIQFYILGSIFLFLVKRTEYMINQAQTLTKKVQNYLDVSNKTTQVVGKALTETNESIGDTNNIIEEVENSVENIVVSSKDIVNSAQGTHAIIHEVTLDIKDVVKQAKDTKKINSEISNITNDNKKNISRFLKSVEDIKNKTDYSKECMTVLQEKIENIKDILLSITSIADQTQLLALNASIEAARCGESGKGFSVIAEQINKLSAESNEYSKSVEDYIEMLEADTKNVVSAIQGNYEMILESAEYINDTNESFEYFINVQSNMEEQINNITTTISTFITKNEKVENYIKVLLKKNEQNDHEIYEIRNAIIDIANKSRNIGNGIKEIAKQVGNSDELE